MYIFMKGTVVKEQVDVLVQEREIGLVILI